MPDPGDQSRDLDHFPFLTRLEVPPAWEDAARLFLERGGPVLVLGAPDTGKSSLGRYLMYKAFAAGLPGALVDLDLGQSHLGPPASLGLGLFPPRLPGDDSLFPESLYFIGQTSPVGAILEVAVGCGVLVRQAARQGIDRVVVNTSGLVHGPGALRLKRAQMELLQPPLILALQRDQELEPLLEGLGGNDHQAPVDLPASPPPPPGRRNNRNSGWTVLRLPISSRVTRKTPEDRRRYREARFRRYFQEARRLALPWRSLVWEGLPWGRGEALTPEELQQISKTVGVPVLYGESNRGRTVLLVEEPPLGPLHLRPRQPLHWLTWSGMQLRLVGLLDAARRTLALALILPDPFNPEEMAFFTPLAPEAFSRVRFVKMGKMRLSLTGKEVAEG
jgi:polynucleotide 5'-hydroxyl-kinase GRC3/NOL9